MAGSKAKLLRTHETGGRRLARHYGDGFGKHLLSAVGWRLTSCVGLTGVECHPPSKKKKKKREKEKKTHKKTTCANKLPGYSQLVRRPRCRPLLASRTRASQSLVDTRRDGIQENKWGCTSSLLILDVRANIVWISYQITGPIHLRCTCTSAAYAATLQNAFKLAVFLH